MNRDSGRREGEAPGEPQALYGPRQTMRFGRSLTLPSGWLCNRTRVEQAFRRLRNRIQLRLMILPRRTVCSDSRSSYSTYYPASLHDSQSAHTHEFMAGYSTHSVHITCSPSGL